MDYSKIQVYIAQKLARSHTLDTTNLWISRIAWVTSASWIVVCDRTLGIGPAVARVDATSVEASLRLGAVAVRIALCHDCS